MPSSSSSTNYLKDPTSHPVFPEIISHYFIEDAFHINNTFNSSLIVKLNQIISPLQFAQYITSTIPEQNLLTFNLDLDLLKTQSPENFLILIKYLQTFGEETFTFLKILIHFHLHLLSLIPPQTYVKLILSNQKEIFQITNFQNAKINSYIMLNAHVVNVSPLKKLNTKINYVCTNCGVINTKNYFIDKNINNYNTFHKCTKDGNDMNNFNTKINKEYTCPINVRYVTIQLGNEMILCLINENDFNVSLLNCNLKVYGIVKTKQENNKNDNTYIKYIYVNQIEKVFPFQNDYAYINQVKNNILTYMKIKHKFSYCYNKLLPKIDYNNLLFFYFLFSLSTQPQQTNEYNLKIHFINVSNNELSNVNNIRRIFALTQQSSLIKGSPLFNLIDNSNNNNINNTNNNKDLYLKSNTFDNNSFDNNSTSYTNLIILDCNDKTIQHELKIINASYSCSMFNYINNHYIRNSYMNKSLLTISTNFDMKINHYDIISLSNEINSNNYNDRKKTNKIIQNEFSSKQHILKKKRNFNAFSIEHTQLHQIDKINNIIEDLYTLDTMSLVDYFKNEILINNNNNDNKSILNDDVDILEYINYANMFINPKITKESYGDIYYLSEHLKNQFQDLQNLSLFDVNWVSVNTLVKIAKISARINLRNKVIKEDIIKGYFITKEFLQQNFVYLLMNKKEKMRGKKAKMNFLIEKLRQFVMMNGKKITMEEIMEFGNIAKHECNELVERLNYEGILIKLNAEDYQITIK